MSFNAQLIKLLSELLTLLRAQVREDTVPKPPSPRDEPEPRRLRQSEQKGVDMNDLLRAAEKERKARRLPRM